MKKTQPKKIVHLQGSTHPDKGRCGKRGLRSRHADEVTCRECQPVLVGATPSTVNMLHRMAGATQ